MVLTVPISSEAVERLTAKAKGAGVDVITYVAALVEQSARDLPSIHEISGETAADFKKSGMSDDDLGDLLEQVKHEMRAEKRSRNIP